MVFPSVETIQDYLIENREVLGGYDKNGNKKIVEIDESLFFKENTIESDITNRTECLMIERGSNKYTFFPVAERSAATLLPIIK